MKRDRRSATDQVTDDYKGCAPELPYRHLLFIVEKADENAGAHAEMNLGPVPAPRVRV